VHFMISNEREKRLKRESRTQLDIDIFGVGQKTQEQFPPFRQRKIIGATFSRVAHGDDDRLGQDRHLAFELIDQAAEVIESKLKKVRRLAHGDGKTEIGRRSDDANNQLVRSARCHILSSSGNQKRAVIPPL